MVLFCFHSLLSPPSQVLVQASPEQGDLPVEVEQETYEEVETVGKALLDRLTVPVIFPDG